MFNSTKDSVIGSLFSVLFAAGTLGNVLSFLYFWPNRHKSLPHKLYLAIVSVDVLTCLSIIPVALSLFNNREATMFSSPVVCCGWVITANFTLRLSMFLVTELSVSRTLLLVWPLTFKHIRIARIALVTVGYAAWLLLHDALFLGMGWLQALYFQDISSCNYNVTQKVMPYWAHLYDRISVPIQILLPSVIVFISFLAGISTFTKKTGSRSSNTSDRESERTVSFRRVSTTIAIFTALFLICNITVFVVFMMPELIHFVPSLNDSWGTLIYDKLNGYGELMLSYFLVVLNATLNPCLYMTRMPGFKEKVAQCIRSTITRALSAVRHVSVVGSTREVVCEEEDLVDQDQGLRSVRTKNLTVAEASGGVALLPPTRAPSPIFSQRGLRSDL